MSSIGFAIAQRLAEEGAQVVISSRKQANVDRATQELKSKGHDVIGVPCHASHKEQRQNLIDEVSNNNKSKYINTLILVDLDIEY